MNLFDNLTQNSLNSIIFKMLNYMTINVPLNLFDDLNNEFIKLELFSNGISNFKKKIIKSGEELLISDDLMVKCSDLAFTHLNYSLKLYYYYLPTDINGNHDGEVLKEMIVPLVEGENIINFEDYPIYLQNNCELLISKKDNTILPIDEIRVNLSVDKDTAELNESIVLTGTVKNANEPVVNEEVKIYHNDNLIDTVRTDNTGTIVYTVNNLVKGYNLFNIVYNDYSSSIVQVIVKMDAIPDLECIELDATQYSHVVVTGYIYDEFENPISNASITVIREDLTTLQTWTQIGVSGSDGGIRIVFNYVTHKLKNTSFTAMYDGNSLYNGFEVQIYP